MRTDDTLSPFAPVDTTMPRGSRVAADEDYGDRDSPWSAPLREDAALMEDTEDEERERDVAYEDEDPAAAEDEATLEDVRDAEDHGRQVEMEMESHADVALRAVERTFVAAHIAAGKRDPYALTDLVFYLRHKEMRGQRIAPDQTALKEEWQSILRDIVQPALASAGQPPRRPAATTSDREVAEALRIANSPVPGMPGMTLERLVQPWRATICPEVPWPILLAFTKYESGGKFTDATHGSAKSGWTSPNFYELGLFQTPGGLHDRCTSGDWRSCATPPPGREVPGSRSAWARLCGVIGADPQNWTNPTTQVRVGLLDLEEGARSLRKEYPDLFPRPGSDWDLRMAVLYRFSRGGGYARSFLRPYRQQLAGMPEHQRWNFLRGQIGTGQRSFKGENVEKKMALAAKLGYVAADGQAPTVQSPQPATPAVPSGAAGTAAAVAGMAAFALMSPRGLNRRGGRRKQKPYGLVVHTTGSGPATIAQSDSKTRARLGCTTAIECALAIYATGEGFPHYVIGYDGATYATCPEDHVAWHAGWTKAMGGAARWRTWSAPGWWSKVWGAGRTPIDLLPAGAASPNSRHFGVELLGALADSGYTDAQYRSLARLVVDLDRRYGLGIDRAPSSKLLGHEDLNPLPTSEQGRANAQGGWDPGAHRADGVKPRFSWSKLWSLIEQERSTPELEDEDEHGPADAETVFVTDSLGEEYAAGS